MPGFVRADGTQVGMEPRARGEIAACITCGGAAREADGRTRGEQLIEHLERGLAERGGAGLVLERVRCLWACKRSCAVLLRAPERPGYVIVELEPSAASARALLDYAQLYLEAPDGAVPYRSWPDALRGHFHCRIPPTSGAGAGAEPVASLEPAPDGAPLQDRTP